MERPGVVVHGPSGGELGFRVEAQGSVYLAIENSADASFRRTSLTHVLTQQPIIDQVQAVCDQFGVPYDDGDSSCVLVQGRSPEDPLVLTAAQLLSARRGRPLGLWRLSDLARERLEPLFEAGGTGAAASLRGLLAAFAEPQFAAELLRQDGLAVVLQATFHGAEAADLAARCLCELFRHEEAKSWLEKNSEHINKELFQQLLAIVFPHSAQGRSKLELPLAGESKLASSGSGASSGAGTSRAAARASLCVCLFLLKEMPQQAGPALHKAAAEVAWPQEPAYLRMARALDSDDLCAADTALAMLYALESAADLNKQLRAQVKEELNAALSMAGQWQPRAVQWMFADTAVKNRLTWSRWKNLADAIADLVGYGKKPEFSRPVRMKITGVRQTGEEEVKSFAAKNMNDAIDTLTEMFAVQQSEERAPRRARFRRQHLELPPGRDAHVLRHLLTASMAVAPEALAPEAPAEAPRAGEARRAGEAASGELAAASQGRNLELLQDVECLKGKVRKQHLTLCRMASFVQMEGFPQVQTALEEIVRSGWDSMTWDRNHSLLHEVAKSVDDPGVVELIALLATDIERRDDAGKRPVDYARDRGDLGVVSLLERLANADSPFRKQQVSAGSNHLEVRQAAPRALSSSPRASPRASPRGAPLSSPRGAEPASGSRRARERAVEELGMSELRTELERTRAELERAQARGLPEGGAASVGDHRKCVLGGPLDDEALQRYATQVQAYGREAVRSMLQRPAFCGGMGLGELDAGRAMAQLDMALRVMQAMAPAVSSTAPPPAAPPAAERSSERGEPRDQASPGGEALAQLPPGAEEPPPPGAKLEAGAGGAAVEAEADGAAAEARLEPEAEPTEACSPEASDGGGAATDGPADSVKEALTEASPSEEDGQESASASEGEAAAGRRQPVPKAAGAKGAGKGPGGKGPANVPRIEGLMPPPESHETVAGVKGGKGGKGAKGPPLKGGPPPKAKSAGGKQEPRKPDIRLDVEMKPLHWKKVARTDGTVWAGIGDDRELLPAEAVTSWFRKVIVTSTKRPSLMAQTSGSPICVITDARTKTSREISLRCLPSPADVAQALREVDASALLPEDAEPGVQLESQLARLSAGIPDQKQKQELEAARAAEPDRPLGLIESYMWELSRIPACGDRLKCWIYVHNVTERAESLCMRLRMFEELMTCFKSPSLQRLLGLFLAVGNYLNAGTRDGRADGFDLDTLKKLDSVKDSQGRDIRHFVMGIFLKHFKVDARALLKDVAPVLKTVTRKVDQRGDSVEFRKQVPSLESYTEDINKFQDEYRSKKELLSKVLSFIEDDADPFTVKMSEEFRRAGHAVEEMVSLREQLVSVYGEVLDWFAASTAPKGAPFIQAFDTQTQKDGQGDGRADPSRCFPRSDDFLLLWDNLLIPPELIERKPWLPDVKYKLGPRFCKAREITVDDLEDLWETQKMVVSSMPGGAGNEEKNFTPRFTRRKSSSRWLLQPDA